MTMELNQGRLTEGLINEILEVIFKYEDSMYLTTVLGALDIVKADLIQSHLEAEDGDDA